MKKITWAAGLALVLFGAGCGLPPSPRLEEQGLTATPETTAAAEIKILSGSFEPAEVTVKVGETFRFTNLDDDKRHWPAVNPHPTHTGLPGFDSLRGLELNEGYSYTFKTAGTWKFHDHLNPRLGGEIRVEP